MKIWRSKNIPFYGNTSSNMKAESSIILKKVPHHDRSYLHKSIAICFNFVMEVDINFTLQFFLL